MSTMTTRLRALAGAALATGVVTASLAAATPASAAPAVPDLKWNVSEQFVRHLFLSHTYGALPTVATGTVSGGATWSQGDPASSADDYFTFKGGTSTTAGDVTTRTYTGTVRGAFVNGGTEHYSVTISDPVVRVAEDGTGSISATVSSATPDDSADATSVTLAEFGTSTTLGESVYATPSWVGVLPAGSQEALDLGLAADKPVDGRSFHPELLANLAGIIPQHFYATGSGSDAYKAPGAIAPAPTVTTTTQLSSYENGLRLKVDGVGFNPTTNPGDAGVYVALGLADEVIDFDDREGGMAALTKVDYIDPSRFVADAFSTVLWVDTDQLDPSKDYAIYTWQAHTHSNTTQDTRTPVAIDWSTLTAPVVEQPTPTTPVPTTPTPATPATPVVTKAGTTAKVKLAKKPTRTAKGKAVVTLTSKGADKPTGKVKVVLKRGKKKVKAFNVQIDKRGRAVVKLPKARAGAYKLVVDYAGDATHTKTRKVLKFRVK